MKVGDIVLKMRLDSRAAPFDLRNQYLHIACIEQAKTDADPSVLQPPAAPVDILDIIDGRTVEEGDPITSLVWVAAPRLVEGPGDGLSRVVDHARSDPLVGSLGCLLRRPRSRVP